MQCGTSCRLSCRQTKFALQGERADRRRHSRCLCHPGRCSCFLILLTMYHLLLTFSSSTCIFTGHGAWTCQWQVQKEGRDGVSLFCKSTCAALLLMSSWPTTRETNGVISLRGTEESSTMTRTTAKWIGPIEQQRKEARQFLKNCCLRNNLLRSSYAVCLTSDLVN